MLEPRRQERGRVILGWRVSERLHWIWDERGSKRGQGHSGRKQSISLTHILRDIQCLRAILFSSSSSEKKSCACVPVFFTVGGRNMALCIEKWAARKMLLAFLFSAILAALNCAAVNAW